MGIEALGALGDFLGGVAVIASLLYLAFQIRQNTKAIRSSSYHQAAEQTWNYCLAVAQDPSLAALIARNEAGDPLAPDEAMRVAAGFQALIFGFENMLRLREEGLVDPVVWQNLIENSMAGLGTPGLRAQLAARPGPLSRRLLAEIEARSHLFPAGPAPGA
jgi:hypothetical protein